MEKRFQNAGSRGTAILRCASFEFLFELVVSLPLPMLYTTFDSRCSGRKCYYLFVNTAQSPDVAGFPSKWLAQECGYEIVSGRALLIVLKQQLLYGYWDCRERLVG